MKLPVLNPLVRIALTVAVSAGASAHATTTITMSGTGAVNATFGDNIQATSTDADFTTSAGAAGIVGTPDISLSFSGSYTRYNNWDGRGSVIQVNLGPAFSLAFTPTVSTAAALQSVDFDEWAGGGNMIRNWTVTGSTSGLLKSGQWTRSTGGRDTVDISATGQLGETLTLSMTTGGGATSYFAIDNLKFDQVPEPSVAVLGGAGLGALALRRRRNRR